MSTVVNTPATPGDSSVAYFSIGLLFTGAIVALFFIYGLPAIRDMTESASTPPTIEVTLPAPAEIPAPTPEPEPAPTATP